MATVRVGNNVIISSPDNFQIDNVEFPVPGWTIGRFLKLTSGGVTTSEILLDDLGDVTTAGATVGQVLGYDGTVWKPMDAGTGGARYLNDLEDVDTSGVTQWQVLGFDGSLWKPAENIRIKSWDIGDNITGTGNISVSGYWSYILVGTGTDGFTVGMARGHNVVSTVLWAGETYANRYYAPFRVELDGDVYAKSLSLSTFLQASSAAIAGNISAASAVLGSWSIGTQLLGTNICATPGAANTARLEVGTGTNTNTTGINAIGAGTDVAIWVGATHGDRGTAPFRVTGAGNLTARDATITGAISVSSGTVGGWSVSSDRFSATNIRLISGTANAARLEVGTGTDTVTAGVNSAAVSGDIVLWAGATHANRTTAPFRVTAAGALTATAGAIGGFTIGTSTISATNLMLTSGASGTANIAVGTGSTSAGLASGSASGDVLIWGGSAFADRATAPFRVTAGGALTALNTTEMRISGGLYVGATGTAPPTGNIVYTSNLQPIRGGTTYTGYVYVPLSTALTHTDWDGDSKNTGTYTLTPAMFGYPAAAKAVMVLIAARWAAASETSRFCTIDPAGTGFPYTQVRAVVANMLIDNTGVATCDASGQFRVQVAGANATAVWVIVLGYFI